MKIFSLAFSRLVGVFGSDTIGKCSPGYKYEIRSSETNIVDGLFIKGTKMLSCTSDERIGKTLKQVSSSEMVIERKRGEGMRRKRERETVFVQYIFLKRYRHVALSSAILSRLSYR